MKKATIKVRQLGIHFACDAIVKVGRKVVHETREYPYGMDHNAIDAAREWAKNNGYTVK